MCPTETSAFATECLLYVMLGTLPQNKDACARQQILVRPRPNGSERRSGLVCAYVPVRINVFSLESCNGKNPWNGWN
jgi:hypothetical protein